MSWFLAFAGFAVLVILHELGHFAAAKAVGMRVEKFSLFFPPTIASKKVGETEYAIGAIPAGGYVKISGMNPDEDLPDEVRTRAYYAQPVWKRIVVIAAGPAVNLVLALVLLFVFFAADRAGDRDRRSGRSRRATRLRRRSSRETSWYRSTGFGVSRSTSRSRSPSTCCPDPPAARTAAAPRSPRRWSCAATVARSASS